MVSERQLIVVMNTGGIAGTNSFLIGDPEVKQAVKSAGGYVATKNYGAGVHEALLHFRAS